MRYLDLLESRDTVHVRYLMSYDAKASKLDYDGSKFDRYAITRKDIVIGEVTVQYGRKAATVRNIIIYDDTLTGQGIGKKVYQALHPLYPNKTFRSSYNVNRVKDQETTGLSSQAIHMWDSLVNSGAAKKQSEKDRFYYEIEK